MRGKPALLLTALFLLFAPSFSAGMTFDVDFRLLSAEMTKYGINQTISGDPVQGALSFLDGIKASYRMKDPAREFKAKRVQTDKSGYRHVRLDQYYQGLPVVGSQVIVHINKDNVVYQVNGRYVPDISISITPSISRDQAIQAGLALFSQKINIQVTQEPRLVIYPIGNRHFLVYHFIISYDDGQGDVGRWMCYLDANTNELIQGYNDIKYIAPPSTDASAVDIIGNRLAGEDGSEVTVQGLHESIEPDTYFLYNRELWWYVFNYGGNNSYIYDRNTYAYRMNAGNWGTSDPVEISAAKNFYDTQNYFWLVHGRYSYDDDSDNPAYAVGNVHYGTNYVNAFWNPNNSQFYFGDGNGIKANPLTVLDIVAHEYGHAWTDYTSNLIYRDEPGALNESFSDIVGASVEFRTQLELEGKDGRDFYPNSAPGYADWLLGEDAWLSSAALRDMRNPSNTVTVGANNEQPSRYHGRYWYNGTGDNGGVHCNSGVQNFFYYLLSEGGSSDINGVNDGLPYNVAGIGLDNARQVAYQTNTYYLGPSETYWQASQGWAAAANDFSPDWVDSVKSAWAAVGMIDVPDSPYEGFENSGFPSLCTTGGNAGWSIQVSDKIQGLRLAQAGSILDSQTTYLEWTGFLETDGIVSFFIGVSSQKGSDWVKFSLDGVEQSRWSGEIPLTSYCSALSAGKRTLRWEYTKNSAGSSGSDTAYLDALSFSATVITHTVSVSSGPDGAISPSGDIIVSHESTPTFTITPDFGYHLARLLVDDTISVDTENGTLVSYTFGPIRENGHMISATFEANPALSGGGGGGGPVGPLAVGISAFLVWWKRRKQRQG